METITYTDAQKKKLYVMEWKVKGNAVSTALRGVKMVQPICNICQGADVELGWWATCKHGPVEKDGSPYWRMRQHIRRVEAFTPVVDADGKETGAFTSNRGPDGKAPAQNFFTLEPNINEVAYNQGHASGRLPGNQRLYKGWKFLEELGIAPMCMLKGCGKAFPTIKVETDYFCSVEHARAVGAREQQVFPPIEGIKLFPGVEVEEVAKKMLEREVVL
jgi:hypothetical protein